MGERLVREVEVVQVSVGGRFAHAGELRCPCRARLLVGQDVGQPCPSVSLPATLAEDVASRVYEAGLFVEVGLRCT